MDFGIGFAGGLLRNSLQKRLFPRRPWTKDRSDTLKWSCSHLLLIFSGPGIPKPGDTACFSSVALLSLLDFFTLFPRSSAMGMSARGCDRSFESFRPHDECLALGAGDWTNRSRSGFVLPVGAQHLGHCEFTPLYLCLSHVQLQL